MVQRDLVVPSCRLKGFGSEGSVGLHGEYNMCGLGYVKLFKVSCIDIFASINLIFCSVRGVRSLIWIDFLSGLFFLM